MIRPITPDDTSQIISLSIRSGLFKLDELDAIQGMLDEYHTRNAANGHNIMVYQADGALVGIAYFVPKAFTDRVWELLMIAVDATRHRQGIGSSLLLAVEDTVRAMNGRLLLIETSDKSSFERTRKFYRKHGYTEVAHISDYFSDGDGKASFLKRV
jgi:ribosomal protein S18 acetylase RimI-like enzyme